MTDQGFVTIHFSYEVFFPNYMLEKYESEQTNSTTNPSKRHLRKNLLAIDTMQKIKRNLQNEDFEDDQEDESSDNGFDDLFQSDFNLCESSDAFVSVANNQY